MKTGNFHKPIYIPLGFTFFIANEFFDALPAHKFFRDPKTRNWQEILVATNNKEELSFIRARERTLANQYVENNSCYNHMEAIEISPKSGVIMQTISERIVEFGGAALIADYGYERNSGYGISGPVSKFLGNSQKCP